MSELRKLFNKHCELLLGFFLCLLVVTLSLTLYQEPKHEYDINNDGVVDIKDMLVIQKYILDNEEVK